jgi:hypothetical protein
MIGREGFLEGCRSSTVHLDRLVVAILLAKKPTEVGESRRHIRMVLAPQLDAHRQHLSVELLRFVVLTVLIERKG